MRRRKAKLLRKLFRLARLAETVSDTDKLDRTGPKTRQAFRDRTAQTAKNIVVFRCYDRASLSGTADYQFFIERLQSG